MGSTISIGDISVKKYYKKKKNRTNLSFLSSSSSSDDKSLCSSKSSDGINVYIDGRRYLESSKYSLPNDDEEIDRMHMQHYISRFIWQKNFCSPLDDLLRYGGAKVLDVGCGAGTFLLEMGHDYPESEFLGIDISPMYPSEIKPSNVKFEQINVLEGLPYDDNSFDFVVIRNMITAFSIDDWDFCIQELIRVTKPEFEIPASNRGEIQSLASAMIANLNKKLVDRSLIGQRCDFRITCDGFEAVIGLRSGGLPKACSSKRWNDKVDLMVAMRDVLLQEAIENNGVGCKDFRKLYTLGVHSYGEFLLQLVCIGLEGKRTVAVRPLEEDKSTLNHIVTIRDELVVKASQLHRDRCSLVHSKPYTFAEQGRVRRKRIQKDS
ncbi:14686_t:CDS:2 [Entrophospora sp. SA101]|nr:14686_t:CDS:2 [Entrophospora sp. SA101]